RRLPRAIRPQETVRLALGNLEADPTDRLNITKALMNVNAIEHQTVRHRVHAQVSDLRNSSHGETVPTQRSDAIRGTARSDMGELLCQVDGPRRETVSLTTGPRPTLSGSGAAAHRTTAICSE